MNIDEIMRSRNNKMHPQDVIKFYTQALHNNKNWLNQTVAEKGSRKEIEQYKKFIKRGEIELAYA